MGKPIVIRFVCPDQDFFHRGKEYVAYILIPGWEVQLRVNDQKLEYSRRLVENPKSFILIDEPTIAEETAYVGCFPDADIVNYPHVCLSCKHKGIK
jgi:hypothetical protein